MYEIVTAQPLQKPAWKHGVSAVLTGRSRHTAQSGVPSSSRGRGAASPAASRGGDVLCDRRPGETSRGGLALGGASYPRGERGDAGIELVDADCEDELRGSSRGSGTKVGESTASMLLRQPCAKWRADALLLLASRWRSRASAPVACMCSANSRRAHMFCTEPRA